MSASPEITTLVTLGCLHMNAAASMPWIMDQVGLIGGPLLVLGYFWLSSYCISRTDSVLVPREGARFSTELAALLTLFSLLVSSITFFGQLAPHIAREHSASASLSQSHTIMITGLLLTPAATAFVAYRPPSGLLRSLLPACYTIFVLLAAFLGILTVLAFENRDAWNDIALWRIDNLTSVLPTLVLTYAVQPQIQYMFLCFRRDLAPTFFRSVQSSLALLAFFYVTIGVLGVLSFGPSIPYSELPTLMSSETGIIHFMKIAYLLASLASLPLIVLSCSWTFARVTMRFVSLELPQSAFVLLTLLIATFCALYGPLHSSFVQSFVAIVVLVDLYLLPLLRMRRSPSASAPAGNRSPFALLVVSLLLLLTVPSLLSAPQHSNFTPPSPPQLRPPPQQHLAWLTPNHHHSPTTSDAPLPLAPNPIIRPNPAPDFVLRAGNYDRNLPLSHVPREIHEWFFRHSKAQITAVKNLGSYQQEVVLLRVSGFPPAPRVILRIWNGHVSLWEGFLQRSMGEIEMKALQIVRNANVIRVPKVYKNGYIMRQRKKDERLESVKSFFALLEVLDSDKEWVDRHDRTRCHVSEMAVDAMLALHSINMTGSDPENILPKGDLDTLMGRWKQWSDETKFGAFESARKVATAFIKNGTVPKLEGVLVHRDLHAQNVLLNSTGHLSAVIDFEEAAIADPRFEFHMGVAKCTSEVRCLELWQHYGTKRNINMGLWKHWQVIEAVHDFGLSVIQWHRNLEIWRVLGPKARKIHLFTRVVRMRNLLELIHVLPPRPREPRHGTVTPNGTALLPLNPTPAPLTIEQLAHEMELVEKD